MSAPPSNADTGAAWAYHDRTKHSYASVQANRHALDFANQPRPYKLYRDELPSVPLPRALPGSHADALSAIGPSLEGPLPLRPDRADESARIDLPLLATLLHHTNGITKRLQYSWGAMDFRAAACTGALYHIELYVVCRAIEGLDAGVYQFAVHDFSLKRLRPGDLRAVLVTATDSEPAVSRAPVTLVATSTYWRNAWKYEERTYRHCFWDLGTCLANLLSMANAHRTPARVVLGFDDELVNRLIDVDPDHEAALALVPLGRADDAAPPTSAPIEPLHLPTVPLSRTDVDYPAIRAMHAASSLSAGGIAPWRATQRTLSPSGGESGGEGAKSSPSSTSEEEQTGAPLTPALAPLRRGEGVVVAPSPQPSPPVGERGHSSPTIEEVIRRRGSSRAFEQTPIALGQLEELLACAKQGIPSDFLRGDGLELNELYLIVNAVDGLDAGAYVFDPRAGELHALGTGDVRERAAYLALTQELAGDAAVNFYFLADLERALSRFGNRGYRAAQLEASITAGRLYLAAYALGLGASGLTFFDDDVTAFFSPHAAGKSVMFLLTLGHPRRRRAS